MLDSQLMIVPPEIVLSVIVLALLAVLIGFWSGSRLQKRRAAEEMESMEHLHERRMADLESHHESLMQQARDAHQQEKQIAAADREEELKKMRDEFFELGTHKDEAHARELSSIKAEHQALIEKLNESNHENIRRMRSEQEAELEKMRTQQQTDIDAAKAEHQRALVQLREDHAQALQSLREEHKSSLHSARVDHAAAMDDLRREQSDLRERLESSHRSRLKELRVAKAEEVMALQSRIRQIEQQDQELVEQNERLERTIRELNESIHEARRTNTFSISQSGERLIRVIHSVQDLARELEETSLTVSGGEYSFLSAIKNERDRDALLKLTGEDSPTDDSLAGASSAPGRDAAAARDTTDRARSAQSPDAEEDVSLSDVPPDQESRGAGSSGPDSSA